MGKYWNFYDGDTCILSEPFEDGDTLYGMRQWWFDQVDTLEYVPRMAVVHLEDFDGKE